ncbi:MAG: YihY/virulence factor BrkB family protein [Caldimicrobium sp.]|nr:YihY/virulence factor BrkB family protein [Caldimicrobium sp.]MDW8183532.1 YihY/virulence factor BrkB family protein [Caldimicrobium sp.]
MKNLKRYPKGAQSLITLFIRKISKDEILLFAQSLTYNTLLTLIPLLGLLFSLSRILLPEDHLIQQIFSFFVKYLTPEALIQVMETIIKILDNLKKFPLGKFSLFLYFLMSLGLLLQIEDALNRIFLSHKRRSLKERILFYWIALNLAPVILLLPFLLQASIQGLRDYHLIFYFLFLFLFFFLVYIYFPARKISKIAAVKGAILGTLLWYSFSMLFGVYVKKAIAYSKLYGSLSVVPLFLIFLFLNWLIFLMGAEITYFLEKKPWIKRPLKIDGPLRALLILSVIASNFYRGKTTKINNLEALTLISEEDLLSTLNFLEIKGWIKINDEEIFLMMPPEKILLSEILMLEAHQKLQELFKELNLNIRLCLLDSGLSEVSLKDLISDDKGP